MNCCMHIDRPYNGDKYMLFLRLTHKIVSLVVESTIKLTLQLLNKLCTKYKNYLGNHRKLVNLLELNHPICCQHQLLDQMVKDLEPRRLLDLIINLQRLVNKEVNVVREANQVQ